MDDVAASVVAFNKSVAAVTGIAHNSFSMPLQLAPASHAFRRFALACLPILAVWIPREHCV
jgi:hypothetical protein